MSQDMSCKVLSHGEGGVNLIAGHGWKWFVMGHGGSK